MRWSMASYQSWNLGDDWKISSGIIGTTSVVGGRRLLSRILWTRSALNFTRGHLRMKEWSHVQKSALRPRTRLLPHSLASPHHSAPTLTFGSMVMMIIKIGVATVGHISVEFQTLFSCFLLGLQVGISLLNFSFFLRTSMSKIKPFNMREITPICSQW